MYILLILTGALLLRIYKLDSIPEDMWGDVNEHYELALRIMQGKFFFHYDFGGDGPLISYLIATVSKVIGLSFYSIKFTTVLVDTASVFVIYHLALALFKKKEIAYISSLLMAVSFWNISLSRQGKPYILVPLFVMMVILFLLKKKNFLAGIFLGLGMYTQASFWGMFIFSFFSPLTFLGSLLFSSRFFWEFATKFTDYFNKEAYIGEKFGQGLSISDKFFHFSDNIIKNLLSFNIRGDSVFRHNIPGNPHLDFITGIFFIAGFVLILYKMLKEKDKNLFKFFLLPFIFAQLSSVLDINNPGNVPSLGRMAGIAPFAYMAAAYAMTRIWHKRKYLISIILIYIFAINFYKYFYIYPITLPNNNNSFSKAIIEEIAVNPDYFIAVEGCCWGEEGQPEPKAIRFGLKTNRKIIFFGADDNDKLLSCNNLYYESDSMRKVLVIVQPYNYQTQDELRNCLKKMKVSTISRGGWQAARAIKGELFFKNKE